MRSPRSRAPSRTSRREIRLARVRRQFRRIETRNASAYVRGERVAAVGLPGAQGNAAEGPQLIQRVALIETADAVHVFRQIARKKQLVAERQIADDAFHHVVD